MTLRQLDRVRERFGHLAATDLRVATVLLEALRGEAYYTVAITGVGKHQGARARVWWDRAAQAYRDAEALGWKMARGTGERVD